MSRVRYLESLAEIRHRLESGKPAARKRAYKGFQFRSHLEVMFAMHLDGRGERWTYEPRTYGPRGRGYLPDFQIVGAPRPTFIEVKPTLREMGPAQSKAAVIWETLPDALIVVAVAEGCTFSGALKDGPWETWQERWVTS